MARQSVGRAVVAQLPEPYPFGAPPRNLYSVVAQGAKLHIGCGKKRLAGWINADGVAGVGDVVMDLQSEFAPMSYSEIYGSHVLEHCWPEDTPGILKRLFNALLPGGTLRLSVPDIRLTVKNCIDGHAYGDERSALAVIFGGSFSKNTAAPDLHRQTFWKERLQRLLAEAGFTSIREWNRGQYPAIDALQDFATFPFDHATGKSLISLNLEATRPGTLPKIETDKSSAVDVSIILGTVDRGEMFRDCIKAVRASLAGTTLKYEIVVAYGRENEQNLTWMEEQPNIVPVLGGMDGAIEAFNKAYDVSRGRYVCQINDDVVVDGDAIARAVRHLDAEVAAAGVVFKFDRGDGKGYRHEMFANAMHPNQMVVRRETCEAVIEEIGAFWGDAKHRTDKTYGGDTLFGVICNYRGLRLDSVAGVTCRDLLAPDQLRTDNRAAVSPDHGRNFSALITPYMTPKPVKADEWPNLYVPTPGKTPRRAPVEAGRPLRLLHLSLKSREEPQAAMREAFAAIGPTVEVPWRLGGIQAAVAAARAHKPEVVFAQIQSEEWLPAYSAALRDAVGPQCTLVLWTGDVRTSSGQPVERWMARIGGEFDILLASNTTYARKLKFEEKVKAATGYMACGVERPIDAVLSLKESPTSGAVFFGTNYSTLDNGARMSLFNAVVQSRVCPLRLYGVGWAQSALAGIGKPFVNKEDTRAIIRECPVTIVTSLFTDLGRYTSDRLPRTAASGGVMAVRQFADMEGYGLRPGENCVTWTDAKSLIATLGAWTHPARAPERTQLRINALKLAKANFTWDRSVQEFLAIVRDFRARKGLT